MVRQRGGQTHHGYARSGQRVSPNKFTIAQYVGEAVTTEPLACIKISLMLPGRRTLELDLSRRGSGNFGIQAYGENSRGSAAG